MPTNYKILGQASPSATTATTLYTVPSSTQAVVSSITVCNRDSGAATYRLAIKAAADGSVGTQSYIVYDATIPANTTTAYTLGVTLGAGDLVSVYASTGTVTFHAYGSEIS